MQTLLKSVDPNRRAFDALAELVAVWPEPYDLSMISARRLVLKMVADAPTSGQLVAAIDDFHAQLDIMTFSIELCGRDGFNLAAFQQDCLTALDRLARCCDA